MADKVERARRLKNVQIMLRVAAKRPDFHNANEVRVGEWYLALAAELEEWKQKHGYEAGRAAGLEARAEAAEENSRGAERLRASLYELEDRVVAAEKRNAELEALLHAHRQEFIETAVELSNLARPDAEEALGDFETESLAAVGSAGGTPQ